MAVIFLRMKMIKNDGCLVGRPAQGLYLVNYFTAAQRQRSPIAILKQFGKHFGWGGNKEAELETSFALFQIILWSPCFFVRKLSVKDLWHGGWIIRKPQNADHLLLFLFLHNAYSYVVKCKVQNYIFLFNANCCFIIFRTAAKSSILQVFSQSPVSTCCLDLLRWSARFKDIADRHRHHHWHHHWHPHTVIFIFNILFYKFVITY